MAKEYNMRKIHLVLMVLLMTISTMAKVNAVGSRVSVFNDLYRFGVADNNDDGETMTVSLGVEDIGNFGIRVDGTAYTNRGHIDRQTSELVQGRADRLTVAVGYDIEGWTDGGSTWVGLRLFGGIDIFGNLGMNKVQDLIHDGLGIYHVDLDYTEESFVAPMGGFELETECGLARVGGTRFSFVTDSRLEISKVASVMTMDIGVALGNIASVSVGGSMCLGTLDEYTVKVATKMQTGLRTSFSFDSGPFGVGFTWYPLSYNNYGIGYFAVDPLALFGGNDYTETDFTAMASLHWQYGRKGYANTLEIGVNDWLSVVGKNMYSTGFPLSEHNDDPWNNPMQSKNLALFVVDGRAELGLGRFGFDWLSFYGEAGLGFGSYGIVGQYKGERTVDDWVGSLIGDLCVGATILPENMLAFGRSSFQLSGYCGLTLVANREVGELFTRNGIDFGHSAWFEPYYGIGLTMNIDL